MGFSPLCQPCMETVEGVWRVLTRKLELVFKQEPPSPET